MNWSSRKRKRVAEDDETSETGSEAGAPADLIKMLAQLKRKRIGGDGLSSHNNFIHFVDDVTSESMAGLNQQLMEADRHNQILALEMRIPIPPIYLFITTYGGSVFAALSAFDCIKRMKSPVYTVVDGIAASAGTILSVAGSKRFMTPNSTLLIHELRSGTWGPLSEMEEEMENLKRLNARLMDIYQKNTKMSRKELKEIFKHDIEWDITECLRRGIVDEIYQ